MLQALRQVLKPKPGQGLVNAARMLARRRWKSWTSPLLVRQVARHAEHLSGPEPRRLSATELVVVCMVRDGAAHVRHFLEHHLQLGARQVVLLDNCSEDSTVALARQFDDVTILRCPLPYRTHKYAFRRFMMDRFGGAGWSLIADIDERFDYPMSRKLPLKQFLAYLNHYGYTAVMAHLLDLFPEGACRSWPSGGTELIEACRWYDNTSLWQYESRREKLVNRYANPLMKHVAGGIRKAAFGVDPILTKYPLLFSSGGAEPAAHSAHSCRHARIADVSCLLAHYKFDLAFRERCLLAVERGNYFDNSREYRAYLAALRSEPQFTLKRSTARRFQGTAELVESGFLAVSDTYREYVRRHGSGPPPAGNAT